MLLDIRNVGQTGIKALPQELSIAVRSSLTEGQKKRTWFTRSNALSVINEFSIIARSSFMTCSAKRRNQVGASFGTASV